MAAEEENVRDVLTLLRSAGALPAIHNLSLDDDDEVGHENAENSTEHILWQDKSTAGRHLSGDSSGDEPDKADIQIIRFDDSLSVNSQQSSRGDLSVDSSKRNDDSALASCRSEESDSFFDQELLFQFPVISQQSAIKVAQTFLRYESSLWLYADEHIEALLRSLFQVLLSALSRQEGDSFAENVAIRCIARMRSIWSRNFRFVKVIEGHRDLAQAWSACCFPLLGMDPQSHFQSDSEQKPMVPASSSAEPAVPPHGFRLTFKYVVVRFRAPSLQRSRFLNSPRQSVAQEQEVKRLSFALLAEIQKLKSRKDTFDESRLHGLCRALMHHGYIPDTECLSILKAVFGDTVKFPAQASVQQCVECVQTNVRVPVSHCQRLMTDVINSELSVWPTQAEMLARRLLAARNVLRISFRSGSLEKVIQSVISTRFNDLTNPCNSVLLLLLWRLFGWRWLASGLLCLLLKSDEFWLTDFGDTPIGQDGALIVESTHWHVLNDSDYANCETIVERFTKSSARDLSGKRD